MPSPLPGDVEVTPEQAQRALSDGSALVVDVREDYEWEAGHADGARHLELERLASSAGTIERERPVVFVCRAGVRSAMAAHAFRQAGFDAWSMHGGMEAWAAEGRPLVPPGGHVAPH
jgi:rhodanese-related sulfurtransferase